MTIMQEMELKRKKRKKNFRRAMIMIASLAILCAMFAVSTFAYDEYDLQPAVTALAAGGGMSDLIKEIFSAFTEVINGLSSGLKDAFSNLIYVDPAATDPAFSPLVLFIFTMAGLGLASGILYKIFGMIRARRG